MISLAIALAIAILAAQPQPPLTFPRPHEHAGAIGDAQDFPAILAAAEALKHRADIRWLVVGDGRAAEWVRSEITRRGLERCVHMLGRHPLERMPAFFRGASALLALRPTPTTRTPST